MQFLPLTLSLDMQFSRKQTWNFQLTAVVSFMHSHSVSCCYVVNIPYTLHLFLYSFSLAFPLIPSIYNHNLTGMFCLMCSHSSMTLTFACNVGYNQIHIIKIIVGGIDCFT